MRRMLVAAAVASMSIASFAGCSQDAAAPSPTPSSATASCVPDRARITWEAGEKAGTPLVGLYVLLPGEYAGASSFFAQAVSVTWDDAGLRSVSATSGDLEKWKSALRTDAVRTGQVRAGYGLPVTVDDPDPESMRPPHLDGHTDVVGITSIEFTMRFSIRCDTGLRVKGSVTAPLPAPFDTKLYRCDKLNRSTVDPTIWAFCPKQ